MVIALATVVVFKNFSTRTKNTSNPTQLSIVTSFYPIYYFTSEIAGQKASVYNITPDGTEPHEYEPTPQDVATMENSDLIILNGIGLEPWGASISGNITDKADVLFLGDTLGTKSITENGKPVLDPHAWLSPVLAKQMVEKVLAALIKSDNKNKDYFNARAKSLFNRLEALDQQYKEALKSCKRKEIVTAHSAFGYLTRDYGLTQISISGLSPDEEPSIKQLAQVAALARQHKVKYIFFERLSSPKLAETIAREVGAGTLILDPIEGLSPQAAAKGDNYETIMLENLKNVRIALECP